MGRAFLLLFSLIGAAAQAPSEFYTYVGAIDEHSVTIAWGTRDDIGRSAKPAEGLTLDVGDSSIPLVGSWIRVEGLEADREYQYTLRRSRTVIAQGSVRTWPEESDSLVFFVIGDWGNGTANQREIGRRMAQERERLEAEGKHVRFILSTGDNIYGVFNRFGTGSSDSDWASKFFVPYRDVLRSIPFYAVLGNHDGNESESRNDLTVYLDNLFFPVPEPARWYEFEFGGLAEFFSLDTTRNTLEGRPAAVYGPAGEQSRWLQEELAKPALPWRIAWMHHPMFTAGPEHDAMRSVLQHWFDEFVDHGVQVVFAGHEHNFQISERSVETGNMTFVVSGAGGQLRGENVRSRMEDNKIAAWAPVRHFLVVELTRDEMRITPVGASVVNPVDPSGQPVVVPIHVPRILN